jgi:DNA polymerase V
MNKKDVGRRHRQAREEVLGLTVADYARTIGVKEVTVYAWEAGRSYVPHEVMGMLEKNYGVSASWMIVGEKEKKKDVKQVRKNSERTLELLAQAVDELRKTAPYPSPKIPMLSIGVSAGLPAEGGDEVTEEIDLTEMLLEHPDNSYFIRVVGDSMTDAGIGNGDTLIVDCAVKPRSGQVVIAKVFGELTVKRYLTQNDAPVLRAENRRYKDIAITPDMEFSIVGVVRSCIKHF